MIDWFYSVLETLTNAIRLENPTGLAALFGLGVLTDIGVPFFFALESFLFFASFEAGPLSHQVLLAVAMLLAGRECGGAVLYWLSRSLGNRFVMWVENRLPWLKVRMEHSRQRLKQATFVEVALVRLTPGLLQVPSLIGGVVRLRYASFAFGVAVSALVYDLTLVLLGFLARVGMTNAAPPTKIYLVFILIGTTLIAWLIFYFRMRRGVRR